MFDYWQFNSFSSSPSCNLSSICYSSRIRSFNARDDLWNRIKQLSAEFNIKSLCRTTKQEIINRLQTSKGILDTLAIISESSWIIFFLTTAIIFVPLFFILTSKPIRIYPAIRIMNNCRLDIIISISYPKDDVTSAAGVHHNRAANINGLFIIRISYLSSFYNHLFNDAWFLLSYQFDQLSHVGWICCDTTVLPDLIIKFRMCFVTLLSIPPELHHVIINPGRRKFINREPIRKITTIWKM